jgi:predicted dehydrogenase
MKGLKKLFRYFLIYGFSRSIIKVAGRTKFVFLKLLYINLYIQKKKSVSLIGAGQFGFSTISYYIQKNKGKIFLDCYDINLDNLNFISKFYNYTKIHSVNNLFKNPDCKIVYIASNHSTHMEYAIPCINNGITVYVEKPLVVNYDQLKLFYENIKFKNLNNKIFLGFNRPFSSAVLKLNKFLVDKREPLSLNFYIVGHKISDQHWYHDPKEGTRICGNVAHWIDLMVNLMNTRGEIPGDFNINIKYTSKTKKDDNFIISINTNYEDIVSIFFTTRCEPFEGVNETLNLQCGTLISKIDDFRTLQIWDNDFYSMKRYFFKNVGHERAILQPFSDVYKRNFIEIEISTIIMLEISEMLINDQQNRDFNVFSILNKLKTEN